MARKKVQGVPTMGQVFGSPKKKKKRFPTLKDMKVPKGGLMAPSLRKGFGKIKI